MLILPDCTSIGFDGDEWKPLLFIGASKLNVVALPLAPDRLAIGKIERNQNVDVSQFNRHAAQASYSFFLSSYTSEELEKFSRVLGGEVQTSISRMAGSAISEAATEFVNDKSDKNDLEERQYASQRAWQDTIPEGGYSYPVSFKDFGDETFAEAVAEEIKAVVAAFSKHLPISFLGRVFRHVRP